MEFFIKQNATLPNLKVEVVKDGRSDFATLYEFLNNSEILFSMVDVNTGLPKIVGAPCQTEIVEYPIDNTSNYYVKFQFRKKDTSKQGRYKGSFMIQNSQGDLVLPLVDELYINVKDSFIETDSCC